MADGCVPDIWFILSLSYLLCYILFILLLSVHCNCIGPYVFIKKDLSKKGFKLKKCFKGKTETSNITLITRIFRNLIVSWRQFRNKGCIFLNALQFTPFFLRWLWKWGCFQTVSVPENIHWNSERKKNYFQSSWVIIRKNKQANKLTNLQRVHKYR